LCGLAPSREFPFTERREAAKDRKDMTKKFRVGILGATGVVGQRFIQLLQNHPQFEVAALAASDRSQGKTYAEACTWRLPGDMPEAAKQIVVQAPAPPLDCDFVFSSLPTDIAKQAEEDFAHAGYPVISNSSPHRMGADVPSLDATDNVIPFIGGEEEKVEAETRKLLGTVGQGSVIDSEMKVSAQCNRVNVTDGHMASIRVNLSKKAAIDEVRAALASFTSLPQQLRLHSAPEKPV